MSRSFGLRYIFPILAGKALRTAARLRGGGSAFPGYATLKLAPDFLRDMAEIMMKAEKRTKGGSK